MTKEKTEMLVCFPFYKHLCTCMGIVFKKQTHDVLLVLTKVRKEIKEVWDL